VDSPPIASGPFEFLLSRFSFDFFDAPSPSLRFCFSLPLRPVTRYAATPPTTQSVPSSFSLPQFLDIFLVPVPVVPPACVSIFLFTACPILARSFRPPSTLIFSRWFPLPRVPTGFPLGVESLVWVCDDIFCLPFVPSFSPLPVGGHLRLFFLTRVFF